MRNVTLDNFGQGGFNNEIGDFASEMRDVISIVTHRNGDINKKHMEVSTGYL